MADGEWRDDAWTPEAPRDAIMWPLAKLLIERIPTAKVCIVQGVLDEASSTYEGRIDAASLGAHTLLFA